MNFMTIAASGMLYGRHAKHIENHASKDLLTLIFAIDQDRSTEFRPDENCPLRKPPPKRFEDMRSSAAR